jgi:DNA-binding winged helix-turn-helix (wHTH) protein/TolB-like protein
MPAAIRYAFDSFIFHLDSLALSRNGSGVRLSEQSARVLAEFMRRPGEVISRQDLSLVLWPDGEFTASEQGINNIISKLRISLRDDPKDPRYIETIPKRGYRFLAPVGALGADGDLVQDGLNAVGVKAPEADAEASAPAPQAAAAMPPVGFLERPLAVPKRSAARRLVLSAVALSVLLVAVGFWLNQTRRAGAATGPEITLAVAPFDVSGNGAAQFSESFRLDLIDELSELPGIRVRAAHSMVPGERIAAGKDGRALGVTAILYTGFSKTGDLIKLHAELVRADDATHLYAWDYSGTAGQLGAIREQMLADIYSYWRGSAPSHQQDIGGTQDPQAYELYLRARYQTRLRSGDGMTAAIQDYRQAIQRDPHFARAYSGLAYTTYRLFRTNAAYQQAETFALQAIALAPDPADAHAILGNIYFRHDWRFAAGVEQMQQAIALEPNDATYHMWLGFMLGNLGRFQEGLDQEALAEKDDPLWSPVYENEANLGLISHSYEPMWRAIDKMKAIKPGSYFTDDAAAWASWGAGRYRQAILYWRQADVADEADDRVALQDRGLAALDKGGPRAYARLRLALALQYQIKGKGEDNDYFVPEWAAYAGDKDLCLSELKQLVDDRDVNSIQIAVIPAFDSLHQDPRFLALVRQVGLPLPQDAPKAAAQPAKDQAAPGHSAARPKNSV